MKLQLITCNNLKYLVSDETLKEGDWALCYDEDGLRNPYVFGNDDLVGPGEMVANYKDHNRGWFTGPELDFCYRGRKVVRTTDEVLLAKGIPLYEPLVLSSIEQQVENIRKALVSTGALMCYGSFTYQEAAQSLYDKGVRVPTT